MISKAFVILCSLTLVGLVCSKPLSSNDEKKSRSVTDELEGELRWLDMMYQVERQKLDKFIKGGEDEAIIKKEDESGDGDGEESGDGDDVDDDDDTPDYKNDDSGDGTDESGEGDDDDDAPDYKNDESGDGTDESGEGDDDDDAPDYKNDDSGDGTDESGEGDDDDYPESQYYGSIAGEITENGDAAYGDSIKNELPSFDDPQRVASHFSRLAEIARKGKLSLKARDSIEDKLIDALLTEYETKGKY
ncbi:PREDICTED: late secretory pathway protein AVL9-like [Acropora digitifera]|uniref:late secretory pathway protein AVL9-like n=1 Tax=Acropora digitifera TaxID=70779 RepID=UPI00077A06A0|nr:PREDICTED: late secretory pathway protein AVL9-like [Acropora digitifera]